MGSQNLLTIPSLLVRAIGEIKSIARIPKREEKSRWVNLRYYPWRLLTHGQNFYRFGFAKSLRIVLSCDGKVMIDGQSRMW
jgi:hypothetical protein